MDTTTHTPPSVGGKTPLAENCGGPNCGQCLKGGMPMKREVFSLLLIASLVATTVMGILYINAKRDLRRVRESEPVPKEEGEKKAMVYPTAKPRSYASPIALPKPKLDGTLSVEKAIATRRTRREFSQTPVTVSEISQMLWSGQGITDAKTGKRAAPSARESYSMTLFVFIREAQGLAPGVYEYIPSQHALGLVSSLDVTTAMKNAGAQEGAQKAPVSFLIASDLGLYQQKTKSATITATYLESGHIAQNLYLTAESLKMATVSMAGFSSQKLTSALQIDPAFEVEYLMPFGHRVIATESGKLAE